MSGDIKPVKCDIMQGDKYTGFTVTNSINTEFSKLFISEKLNQRYIFFINETQNFLRNNNCI